MNTARIVVPTLALSAGGVAAYPASQPVSPEHPRRQAWPAATPGHHSIRREYRSGTTTKIAGSSAGARQIDILRHAQRSGADINMVESRTDDDQAPQRSQSVGMVRYGVPGATTTQK
jgi:hypothetical protein